MSKTLNIDKQTLDKLMKYKDNELVTSFVSQYTDTLGVSITELSHEFWEWLWLGYVLGIASQGVI